MGVLRIRALLFGVYGRALDFLETWDPPQIEVPYIVHIYPLDKATLPLHPVQAPTGLAPRLPDDEVLQLFLRKHKLMSKQTNTSKGLAMGPWYGPCLILVGSVL